jgi:hypothetical protein
MSGGMTAAVAMPIARSSTTIAAAIAAADFSRASVTVIGYGAMGAEYVKAVRALGVPRIRVCSRSTRGFEELRQAGIEAVDGGVDRLTWRGDDGELAIVVTPVASLVAATRRLLDLGFRRVLVEKPVSLFSHDIDALGALVGAAGATAACAYNRVAYPSFFELAARAADDGGITSATYSVTEIVKPDWPNRFPAAELARWGVANTLHVVAMAHGLIGLPAAWMSHRSGVLSWHPSGAVFVGSGISDRGIPFSYHGDWLARGRWGVEIHTAVASYRLCPLETLSRRVAATGDWEPVPVTIHTPNVKAGLVEQVAAMLEPRLGEMIHIPSLTETARLTRFAEDVFGYRHS